MPEATFRDAVILVKQQPEKERFGGALAAFWAVAGADRHSQEERLAIYV